MNSNRRDTENLITSTTLCRDENSGERQAPSAPVSNCKYPTGVMVAGVDTVGLPGFASGPVFDSCAERVTERAKIQRITGKIPGLTIDSYSQLACQSRFP